MYINVYSNLYKLSYLNLYIVQKLYITCYKSIEKILSIMPYVESILVHKHKYQFY